MGFLRRIFSRSPSGTGEEQILAHIAATERAMKAVSLAAFSAAQDAGDKIRKLVVTQPGQFRKLLVDERMSAENIVAAMMANQCDLALSTGRFHIYRGTLSDQGLGRLALFRYAIQQMIKSGHLDRGSSEELISALQQTITEIG